jgi:uncharacterized protein (DUF2267 family)
MNSIVQLEKYFAERNEFLKELSENLNHPNNPDQVERALRAVLHILRERLTIQESLHVLSQLPVFLKLLFIEGWKYHEKPERIRSIEKFKEAVKDEQFKLGERDFDWAMSTEKIINTILVSLRKYISRGEILDVLATLPAELHPLFV